MSDYALINLPPREGLHLDVHILPIVNDIHLPDFASVEIQVCTARDEELYKIIVKHLPVSDEFRKPAITNGGS